MPSHADAPGSRRHRRGRAVRPSLHPLEPRVVPSLSFSGIAGVTFDTYGDVFVSYNSTNPYTGQQQQSVAEIGANGHLASASVFTTTGASAFPGVLTTVGSSATLPTISDPTDILELQPNGQLFVFNPVSGAASQYDNLASDVPNASNVYDVQTGSYVNLTGKISLANATYGDFGVYGSSIVVSAESNMWDFVMRVTYGVAGRNRHGPGRLAGQRQAQSAAPGGVAVGPQGTVLATLPYLPSGSTTAIHVPVGFNLFYDQGDEPPALDPLARPDLRPGHRQRRDHGRLAEQLHPGRRDVVALRRRARGRRTSTPP